jgi:hypothetical protein
MAQLPTLHHFAFRAESGVPDHAHMPELKAIEILGEVGIRVAKYRAIDSNSAASRRSPVRGVS